jgi:small-conductance mechanosensitive channel
MSESDCDSSMSQNNDSETETLTTQKQSLSDKITNLRELASNTRRKIAYKNNKKIHRILKNKRKLIMDRIKELGDCDGMNILLFIGSDSDKNIQHIGTGKFASLAYDKTVQKLIEKCAEK